MAKYSMMIALVLAVLLPPMTLNAGVLNTKTLDALVKKLQEHAEKWDKDELESWQATAMLKKLRSYTYDGKSVVSLLGHIKKAKSWKGLYVSNRLLHPLLRSDVAVVKQALAEIKKADRRLARGYLSLGRSPAISAPKGGGKMKPDAMMSLLARYQAAVERKLLREEKIRRRNQEIYRWRVNFVNFMFMVNDKKEDAAIVRDILKCEKKGEYDFTLGITVVVKNAKAMDAKRSEFFYKQFVKYGKRLERKRTRYIRPYIIDIRIKEASLMSILYESPGVVMLNTANVLAAKAKQKRVSTLDKDINKAINLILFRDPAIARSGGMAFHRILLKRPATAASKQARNMLANRAFCEKVAGTVLGVALKYRAKHEAAKKKLLGEIIKYYPKTAASSKAKKVLAGAKKKKK